MKLYAMSGKAIDHPSQYTIPHYLHNLKRTIVCKCNLGNCTWLPDKITWKITKEAQKITRGSIGESVKIIRELQELRYHELSVITGIPQSTSSYRAR